MYQDDVEARVVDLGIAKQADELRDFLRGFGLSLSDDVEFAALFYRDGRVVGAGAIAGKVLRNIAVAKDAQGSGVTAAIVTRLIEEQRRRGRYHYFLFTRPNNAAVFTNLGFREVARAEPYAAFLEMGGWSISDYCGKIAALTSKLPAGQRAALVVNCNPFTLGHQALIARAAAENNAVIVFVVSEDRSLFPFADRIRLVREGTKDYPNVCVVPGEDYIISAATFPAYFTRGEEAVAAQTRLDSMVFAPRIAPRLGITRRYAGEEPYCPVTAAYNQALTEILPRYRIEVVVAARIAVAGSIISASKVREMLKNADWDGVKRMVPESTYRYLLSDAAREVIGRSKSLNTRH